MKLHQYIEWMREDLAYKSPEQFGSVLSSHLRYLLAHFPDVEQVDLDERADSSPSVSVEVNTPSVREAISAAVYDAVHGEYGTDLDEDAAVRLSAAIFVLLDRASAGLPLDAEAVEG